MVGTDERLRILRLLEEGRITADEAAQLLAALGRAPDDGPRSRRPEPRPRLSSGQWLRVRVTDLASGRTKVSIRVPLGVMNALVELGGRFAQHADRFHMAEIMAAVQRGQSGRIVDVRNEEAGEQLEVLIDDGESV